MGAALSAQWIVAGLAVTIAAPLLALALKHWYFDAQRRLRIEVGISEWKTSTLIRKLIDEKRSALPWEDKERKALDASSANHGAYFALTIRNTGKKKITGLTLFVKFKDLVPQFVYQVNEEDELIKYDEKPLSIGDLQPKHITVVHLWFQAYLGVWHVSNLKALLRFSADELDTIRLRFPSPRYLRMKYLMWAVWGFSVGLMVFNIVLWTKFVW